MVQENKPTFHWELIEYPFISLLSIWSILDSVQEKKIVRLLGLLNICEGLHFKRIPGDLKAH